MSTSRCRDRATCRPRIHRAAEARLEAALRSLTSPEDADAVTTVMTVTELCRLAGVSRNSLYRDYPEVLDKFHQHQKQCRKVAVSATADRLRQLREENAAQRKQLAQLAALVDHYWLAYQEASGVLARRERELADLRKTLHQRSDPISHPKIVVRNRMLTTQKDT
jgi:uncharacterized Zn finger protein